MRTLQADYGGTGPTTEMVTTAMIVQPGANVKGKHGMEEGRIKALEEKERALMLQSIEGATTGAVSPSLHQELVEVRAELKTARRVRAMDKNRTEPKLTRSYNLTFSEDEFNELSERAEKKGIKLSKYIRGLINSGLKVEDEAP